MGLIHNDEIAPMGSMWSGRRDSTDAKEAHLSQFSTSPGYYRDTTTGIEGTSERDLQDKLWKYRHGC